MQKREEERKGERKGEREVGWRIASEEVGGGGGQRIVEDVMDWVEVQSNVKRRTVQGRCDEECRKGCRMV